MYELIRSRGQKREAPVEKRARSEEPPAPAPEPSSFNWLSPGRTVRVPIGYVLLGGAVVIAGVIAAYVVGYTRAQSVGRAAEGRNLGSQVEMSLRDPPPQDPLANVPSGWPDETVTGTRGDGAVGSTAARGFRQPIFTDPRQPGFSYFVIAETSRAGAERLAGYCRENDLEAYVIDKSTDRLRRVIVVPGFAPGARSSRQVKALEARIHDVGDKWKTSERGASDLRDAYPLLFTG